MSSDMMALRNFVTQKDEEQFSRLPDGKSSFILLYFWPILVLCCLGLTTSVASSVGSIAVISDKNTEKVRVVHIYIYIFICTGY